MRVILKNSGPILEVPEEYRHYFAPRGKRTTVNAELPPPAGLSGGLEPLSAPLTKRQVDHLLRRAEFGGTPERRAELLGQEVSGAVTRMINGAKTKPVPPPPSWRATYPPWNRPAAERQKYFDIQEDWFDELIAMWIKQMVQGGLREKMMLFWTDHFATERATYFFTIMAWQYLTVINEYALGNFRDFVLQMGLSPPMLVYLDGRLSTRESPNENYSRELLELFTMGQFDKDGQPNYTQDDIVEMSRALTGYTVDYGDFTARYALQRADTAEKTIMGRTDRYNFGAVHQLIFDARPQQIADFIARKLYKTFVYVTPNEEFVGQMADMIIRKDFEIAPVMEALLKSSHFYSDEVMGTEIKSPVALYVGLFKDMGEKVPTARGLTLARWHMGDLSQRLLNPPNVAGWPGYRSWISTSTLPDRWEKQEFLLHGAVQEYHLSAVEVARKLVDPEDPLAVFKVPVALAEHFLNVPLEDMEFDSPRDFSGDLHTFPIPEEIVNGPSYVVELTKIFLGGFPWYVWSLNRQGIAFGMLLYMKWLTKLPEFQLT